MHKAKAPCVCLYACIHVCVTACVFVYVQKHSEIWGFEQEVEEDSPLRALSWSRTNTFQPQTRIMFDSICVFKYVWGVIAMVHSFKTHIFPVKLSHASQMYLWEISCCLLTPSLSPLPDTPQPHSNAHTTLNPPRLQSVSQSIMRSLCWWKEWEKKSSMLKKERDRCRVREKEGEKM